MRGSFEMVQHRSLIDPQFMKSQDLGEITPAFFRSGPSQTRSCTDIFCLLMFWIATFLLWFIMALAFSYGDPKLLYMGYDISNNACGDGNYTNYPFLYFYNTSTQANGVWDTICVSSCPIATDTTINCGVNSVITDCSDSQITIYDTYPYMGFLCLPTNVTIYANISSALSEMTGFTKILLEIRNNWALESIMLGFAYLLGIACIFTTLCAPHFIVIFFLICVFVGFLGFGSIFILDYADPTLLFSILEAVSSAASIDVLLSSVSDNFKLIAGIINYVMALLLMIYVIVFYRNVFLLMKILMSTSLFVRARKSFTFLSFLFFFVVLGYIMVWVFVLLYLYTWSTSNTSEVYSTPFFHFTTSPLAIFCLIAHVIGFFWNIAFIYCTYVFLLNASCVFWYFSHADWEEHDRKLPHPLRYNFGSVALGAFLMLFFRWFNASFGYFYHKVTDYSTETQNKCAQYTIKTCVCFMICYDKWFKCITKDGFISVALTGKHFLAASNDAFYLTKRNKEKYERVEGLGNLVLWLGKLFICLIASLVTFFLSLYVPAFAANVYDPLIPVIVVFCVSFLLGNIVMNLLATITDSLIYLYLIDEEIEKVHYNEKNAHSAPEVLREFMKETLRDIYESDGTL